MRIPYVVGHLGDAPITVTEHTEQFDLEQMSCSLLVQSRDNPEVKLSCQACVQSGFEYLQRQEFQSLCTPCFSAGLPISA